MQVKCDNCNKEFEREKINKRSKHLFCCQECFHQWQSKNIRGKKHHKYNQIKVECEECGKVFYKKPYRHNKDKHHFCSNECKGKWREGKIKQNTLITQCSFCGKKIKREKNHQERNKTNKYFCSRKCSSDWRKEQDFFAKEKNPQWKGGKSFEPYGEKWNDKLKEKIRKRDNYQCQECGKKQKENGKKLDVHHIDYNKKNNNPNNLIALCISCHRKTNYNRQDWTKYYQKKLCQNKQ